MISIIIPVYNQANKLVKCLDSILNQTFKDFEIIIVNDGSTDNINEVIKDYKNKLRATSYELRVVSQENKGANSARNRGFVEAKGEYIIFCDADVIMEPDMLAIMLKALRDNPSASYAYSSFMWGKKLFKLWPFSAEKLLKMPYITTTTLIRREHFPGFDEKLKRLQDWDLWLTMLEQGHTGVWINKVLFKVATGGTISLWLPSFAYKLFPLLPQVKKYKEAIAIIKEKHKILPFNKGG